MAKQKTVKVSASDKQIRKTSFKKRLNKIKPSRRNIDRQQRVILRHTRKFLLQRWGNLRVSRRGVVGWLSLIAVLIIISCLQTIPYARNRETVAAANNGMYAEGIVDKITTINPLYITTDGERAVSELVYSGLLRLDETGNLRPELATSYSISEDKKTYSVKLRENVKWSDGEAFSADDIIFTIELIKNPATGSSLFNSWRNVEVKKTNDFEVSFTLKNALASFPFTLNFGILPSHILKDVKPADLKSMFSNNPVKVVGTGAFAYRDQDVLNNGQITLKFVANERYFRGSPRLSLLTIRTYATSEDLLKGFQRNEINVAAGLSINEAVQSLQMPNAKLVQPPLGDGVFALFNNDRSITSELSLREALRLGTDLTAVRQAVIPKSDNDMALNAVSSLHTPLTPGLMSDVDKLRQPSYNLETASEKLEAAGWKLNSAGKRVKDGEPLALNIVTVKGADYESAAKNLAEQWGKLGIEVEFTAADPANIQQNFVIPREYDVLVYELHIGADPDVFAYWASSQATARGLNFANYKSTLADISLSNARTQLDEGRRNVRYADFVSRWLADAPAIALYQPNYYYLTNTDVVGLSNDKTLFEKSARFADVQDFTVETRKFKATP